MVREVGDQQTGVSAAVVVGSVHAHSRARHAVFAERHAGDDSFFSKRSIAVISIQLVRLRVVREKQIGPAVVVVIEHRNAQRF